jgi:hypothetical protein
VTGSDNKSRPAIIHVGATYTDLGAQITGPKPDLNLGITTYVNGAAMNPVKLDTTQAATDTIAYVATDQTGLAATSTRTVIVQAAPSIVPTDETVGPGIYRPRRRSLLCRTACSKAWQPKRQDASIPRK